MATQNKKKILDLGFNFYKPKTMLDGNHKEKNRSRHRTRKNINKSRIRANYNSMFYGY